MTLFNKNNINLQLREWFFLAVVLFICRSSAALVLDALFNIEKDVDWYATIARNMIAGHGFVIETGGQPILWRGPVYPLFLAMVWKLAGDPTSFVAVLIAQSLLDTGTALLIFYMGKHYFGKKSGLIAAFLFIIYPISVYYSPRFLPTSLYTFFITLLIATFLNARTGESLWRYILCGLFAGITTMIKASAIYLIPFIILTWIIKSRLELKQITAPILLFIAGSALILVPWGIRSYVHSGVFSISGTSGGYSLWLATRIESEGREEEELKGEMLEDYLAQRKEIMVSARIANGLDPELPTGVITWDDDEAFKRAAIKQIKGNLWAITKNSVHKAYRFWFEIYHLENRWAHAYIELMQLGLLGFSIYGIFIAWRKGIDTFPVVTTLVYFTLLHAATISTLRYSIPLIPLVSVFASTGFLAFLEILKRRLKINYLINPYD